MTGLSGNNEVTEQSISQQNFTGSGRVISVRNGVGFVGLRAGAQASDAFSALGDEMPGPATAIGGIRVSGFESMANPPLPSDIFAYFRSGSRFRVSGPDWLTDITELPDDPFPEFVPEPSSGLMLLVLCVAAWFQRIR